MKMKIGLTIIVFAVFLSACSKNSDDSSTPNATPMNTEPSKDKPKPQASSTDTISSFSTCINEINIAQPLIDSTLVVFSRAFGEYAETINLRNVSSSLTELKLYLSSTESNKNKKAKAAFILQDSINKVESIRDSVFRMAGNVQEYRDLEKSITSLKRALESVDY